MNDDGYRINGGIGFSIDTPVTNSHFMLSNDIEIYDKREKKFTQDEQKKLYDILENVKHEYKMNSGITCIIESEVFPHYGLGSSTSIYLSCIEALFLLNEISCDRKEIISLSTRGGTSGVGINTYFEGGYVFDIGIKNEKDLLVPSSIADRKGKKPLAIYKGKTPDWKIGICIPYYLNNKSEQEEKDFFNKHCPIEKIYVNDILYESIYGVTSSVIEGDYKIFCQSINTIQQTRWKYLERSLYGKSLQELEQKIFQLGADCVGMSSLGHSLFFIGNNIDNIINELKHDNSNLRCYISKMNNQGRLITYA
jgi:beta-ribofuranosylaminobenzene 5'-phosphate synthase